MLTIIKIFYFLICLLNCRPERPLPTGHLYLGYPPDISTNVSLKNKTQHYQLKWPSTFSMKLPKLDTWDPCLFPYFSIHAFNFCPRVIVLRYNKSDDVTNLNMTSVIHQCPTCEYNPTFLGWCAQPFVI